MALIFINNYADIIERLEQIMQLSDCYQFIDYVDNIFFSEIKDAMARAFYNS